MQRLTKLVAGRVVTPGRPFLEMGQSIGGVSGTGHARRAGREPGRCGSRTDVFSGVSGFLGFPARRWLSGLQTKQ